MPFLVQVVDGQGFLWDPDGRLTCRLTCSIPYSLSIASLQVACSCPGASARLPYCWRGLRHPDRRARSGASGSCLTHRYQRSADTFLACCKWIRSSRLCPGHKQQTEVQGLPILLSPEEITLARKKGTLSFFLEAESRIASNFVPLL